MGDVLAMILAGGRVDELSVLTFYRPKAAMPFGGLYRIIDFPMSNLMHSGIRKVGILAQYQPFRLMNHIGSGVSWDMVGRNRFAQILPPFKGRTSSDWYQGSADAVYQNRNFIRLQKPELVVVLSGDHVYKMDYGKLISFHVEKGADLTIAFTEVPKAGADRFGLGTIGEGDDRGGRLLEYREKPKDPTSTWASLTIYVFNPKVLFEALEENAGAGSHEFGKDVIPSLLGRRSVYGYKHRGYWGYTRTLQEYWRTSRELLGRRPGIDLKAWEVATNLAHRDVQDRQPALVGANGVVEDSLFYSGCIVEGKVTRSILFPGVRVGRGSEVEDSILLPDAVIGRGSRVVRSVLDVEVSVGEGTHIGDRAGLKLAVVGYGTTVPGSVRIHEGVVVYPNLKPEQFLTGEYQPGETIR
jgi:glucose-1-phosphate adenylyltransferase